MLYEYSSDKVEVCLFIPFLDRIFKDRDDRDSFLQFIKIGYGWQQMELLQLYVSQESCIEVEQKRRFVSI